MIIDALLVSIGCAIGYIFGHGIGHERAASEAEARERLLAEYRARSKGSAEPR